MDTECIWNGYDEKSKILQMAWSKSVMTTILAMSSILLA